MCLFCKIVSREIPAQIVHEDDDTLAFRDIHPAAPTHVLVVPKKHVTSLNDADDADALLYGKLVLAAKKVAHANGLDASGWRLAVNTGPGAGQSVFHVHLHVLGGRAMAWPPG